MRGCVAAGACAPRARRRTLNRHRLGIALVVEGAPRHEIDGLRRACGGVRTVDRVAPHLTLVPPVNVRADRLDDATGLVRAAAASTAPIRVTLGPVETFSPDTPVLYLAVGPSPLDPDAATKIAQLRGALAREPLERPTTWPFVPHVTVAEDVAPGRIAAAIDALRDYEIEVSFDRVTVLEEGPDRRWTALTEVPFGRPRVVGRGGLELELSTSTTLEPDAHRFFAGAWGEHLRRSYGDGPAGVDGQPFAVTARRAGTAVGVASGTLRPGDEGGLDRLVVDRTVRAEGVGSQLLAEVEHLAALRRCTRLVLVVQAGSDAEAFYRGRGWVTDVVLPRWRSGRDFVRLARSIPQQAENRQSGQNS